MDQAGSIKWSRAEVYFDYIRPQLIARAVLLERRFNCNFYIEDLVLRKERVEKFIVKEFFAYILMDVKTSDTLLNELGDGALSVSLLAIDIEEGLRVVKDAVSVEKVLIISTASRSKDWAAGMKQALAQQEYFVADIKYSDD